MQSLGNVRTDAVILEKLRTVGQKISLNLGKINRICKIVTTLVEP